MPVLDPVPTAIAGAYLLLLLVAASVDVLRRRIPNWTVLALVGLFVVAAGLGVLGVPWWSSLAAGGIGLAGAYLLYHFDLVGAGDAKLFAAAALFAGLSGLPLMALFTALAGGLLALGFLFANPRRVMRGLTARGRAEGAGRGIPYGVAIAAGASITGVATLGLLG